MTPTAAENAVPSPIRVGLIDDEPLIRAGLRTILEADPAIRVVLEHGDGLGAVSAVQGAGCDVVLMDVRMPGRSGLDAIDDLRAAGISARLVVLTTFADAEYLRRAVEASVDGYVTKASAPDDLIAAVRTVYAGGAALSPVVARWLLENAAGPMTRQADARQAVSQLTERQQEVLLGIARGEENAQIARNMHLADATVKGYVSEILQRLNVTRRVQAAVLAHQAGLM
ncbi:response regulator transcription factor [Saxibacter everestensis]|uniref:Response regulator transcription factor n=1 Tax=Saxibacter everestensis TaxID=2909229 RepID=A0ABY8QXB2_9MICO|nr:response regulator transcription factor [Brevibacteriaceae bacterium ZFBP1038]